MQVNVTTFDDSPNTEYTADGHDLRVVTYPHETDPNQVTVDIWDAAGLAGREDRPADQAQRIALKTLFDNIRSEDTDATVAAEAV
jgi:hypothetical protein